jgi:hypothetical protein
MSGKERRRLNRQKGHVGEVFWQPTSDVSQLHNIYIGLFIRTTARLRIQRTPEAIRNRTKEQLTHIHRNTRLSMMMMNFFVQKLSHKQIDSTLVWTLVQARGEQEE